MIRAVIFDCFGVIISDALEALCRTLEVTNPAAVQDVHDLVRTSNAGFMDPVDATRQIANLFGLTEQEYRAQIAAGEVKDAQLLAYIQSDLRPTYKIGLLTNIGGGGLARRFDQAEIDTYFDAAIASGDIGYAKPSAQAYEITAERLGATTEECVFVDDREPYCEGARATGMHAILYKNFPQFRTDFEALLANS